MEKGRAMKERCIDEVNATTDKAIAEAQQATAQGQSPATTNEEDETKEDDSNSQFVTNGVEAASNTGKVLAGAGVSAGVLNKMSGADLQGQMQ